MKRLTLAIIAALAITVTSCGPKYVVTGFNNCRYVGFVRCEIYYRNLKTNETGFVIGEKNPLKVNDIVRIKFAGKMKIRQTGKTLKKK